MQHMKTVLIGLAAISLALSPLALAESTGQAASVAELQQQVNALKAQIAELQGKLAATREEISEVRKELKLARALSRGAKGDDVAELQKFLAQYPDIFPEALITGFFGELTERAVKRFQKKHDIEQAGIVGPITRARLHELFISWSSSTTTPRMLPPGLAKKLAREAGGDNERGGRGRGHDKNDTASTTPGTASTTPESKHKITICHKKKNTISIAISAWSAHYAHGDMIGACPGGKHDDDDDGDENDDDDATTTPDRVAPLITGFAATSTATTTTTILWTTNEVATSKTLYGTSTPITNANSSMVTNSALVTAHSLALSGLFASTTYYALAVSSDAVGNTATSSELSFTTLGE